MAVMAVVRLRAQGVVVFHVERPVAVERDQGSRADVDRVGAQRQGLGHVGAAADAAGDDELHLAVHVELLQRFHRQPHGRQGRNADMLDEDVLGCGRAAAVNRGSTRRDVVAP